MLSDWSVICNQYQLYYAKKQDVINAQRPREIHLNDFRFQIYVFLFSFMKIIWLDFFFCIFCSREKFILQKYFHLKVKQVWWADNYRFPMWTDRIRCFIFFYIALDLERITLKMNILTLVILLKLVKGKPFIPYVWKGSLANVSVISVKFC